MLKKSLFILGVVVSVYAQNALGCNAGFETLSTVPSETKIILTCYRADGGVVQTKNTSIDVPSDFLKIGDDEQPAHLPQTPLGGVVKVCISPGTAKYAVYDQFEGVSGRLRLGGCDSVVVDYL